MHRNGGKSWSFARGVRHSSDPGTSLHGNISRQGSTTIVYLQKETQNAYRSLSKRNHALRRF
ncbi:MAG TPA: hypothetical protein VK638_49370, partial [Edaphobacter sp.]|nr:hypothetical protein [Edaphobacter sp.]